MKFLRGKSRARALKTLGLSLQTEVGHYREQLVPNGVGGFSSEWNLIATYSARLRRPKQTQFLEYIGLQAQAIGSWEALLPVDANIKALDRLKDGDVWYTVKGRDHGRTDALVQILRLERVE